MNRAEKRVTMSRQLVRRMNQEQAGWQDHQHKKCCTAEKLKQRTKKDT